MHLKAKSKFLIFVVVFQYFHDTYNNKSLPLLLTLGCHITAAQLFPKQTFYQLFYLVNIWQSTG